MIPKVRWKSETYAYLDITLDSTGMMAISHMPAFWRFEGRSVLFKPVGANVAFILERWPEAEWTGGTERYKQAWLAACEVQDQVRADKRDATLLDRPDDFDYLTQPYDHQRKAFVLSRDREYFGLFMDPGTGKTKVTLDTAAYLQDAGKVDTLLVVAPNGVHWNWVENEIPVHLPRRTKADCYVDSGARSKRQADRFKQVLGHRGMGVFAFHVEGLTSDVACERLEQVLTQRRCLWVIDESSRIKTPAAKRTQWIVSKRKLAPYRRILTGTPITKGLEDLYSQFLFLSPMILGFETYTAFKARYCNEREFGQDMRSFKKIVGYLNVPELINKVDGCTFRVRKEDCLDLPPKRYQRHSFELTPKARKLYDQMATEFMAEMDGQVITENLAITRLLRLQQIACGWWPSEDDRKLIPIEDTFPRLQALKRILEDLGDRKVIIWARFQADFALLQKELGNAAVSYHGGVSDAGRQQALHRFRNDPTCFYMVANPQNAGIGLTLNEASVHVWYCNQFDLELRIQGEDRSHRIGQTSDSVLYIDIEARRTMESKVIQALRAKKNVADLVTLDPKSFFLVYEQEAAA